MDAVDLWPSQVLSGRSEPEECSGGIESWLYMRASLLEAPPDRLRKKRLALSSSIGQDYASHLPVESYDLIPAGSGIPCLSAESAVIRRKGMTAFSFRAG
jgi:hypothetical protein